MITLVIALTNYVPEVSVIHGERTLFKNTWYKLHVGGTFNLRKTLSDNLKQFLIIFVC
jgi:hypothetical protein